MRTVPLAPHSVVDLILKEVEVLVEQKINPLIELCNCQNEIDIRFTKQFDS